MCADKVYTVREKFRRKVGISADIQDSRLLTHYFLYAACVKKVYDIFFVVSAMQRYQYMN